MSEVGCPIGCRLDLTGRPMTVGDRVRVRGVGGVAIIVEAKRIVCGACRRPKLMADFGRERLMGQMTLVEKR